MNLVVIGSLKSPGSLMCEHVVYFGCVAREDNSELFILILIKKLRRVLPENTR